MSANNVPQRVAQGYPTLTVPMTSTIPNQTPPKRLKGYPTLAGEIEMRPEMAMFRRFGALNAENILYLQAELISLEGELRKQQSDDNASGHENKVKYAVNWLHLRHSRRNGDTKQLDLILKIRESLSQYSTHSTAQKKQSVANGERRQSVDSAISNPCVS
jgi:hypothetical protein